MKIKYNRKEKSIIEKQYEEIDNYIKEVRGSEVINYSAINYSATTYTISSYRTIVLLTWFDLEDKDDDLLLKKREQLLNELDELFILVTEKAIEIE